MDLNSLQSHTLKALRFPLAVMVVFIHSTLWPEGYLRPDWSSMTSQDMFVAIQIVISHVVSRVAVSAFYVISGFLFFFKMEDFTVLEYPSNDNWMIQTLRYLLTPIVTIAICGLVYWGMSKVCSRTLGILTGSRK